jgi:protoheme IX farnesyltransferase
MKNMGDFIALTKPRLNFLAILTTLAGFYMGSRGHLDIPLLAFTLLGAIGVAAGCGTLNQFLEAKEDGLMVRTQNRPLPAGRLPAPQALGFGLALSAVGLALLYFKINELSAFLGASALVIYLVFYTPLKKVTPLCTVVGALTGAIPPLLGYVAATGHADLMGLSLFGILFFWQIPHFLAIGHIYREDYVRAQFSMLCVTDPQGKTAGLIALAYAVVLLPVALLPVFLHMTGPLYFGVALALSLGFLGFSLWLASRNGLAQARRLFWASIVYLPLLFLAMVMNKT